VAAWPRPCKIPSAVGVAGGRRYRQLLNVRHAVFLSSDGTRDKIGSQSGCFLTAVNQFTQATRADSLVYQLRLVRFSMVPASLRTGRGHKGALMADSTEFRILVKMKPGTATTKLALDGAKFRFTAEPLFKSIGRGKGRRPAAPATNWHLLRSTAEPGMATAAEIANPWDVCHQLLDDGIAAGGRVEFAEPDLQQQWLIGRPVR